MTFLARLLTLALFLCPALLWASAELDRIGSFLDSPHHLYGTTVAPGDLAGRVVVIWNITDYVSQGAASLGNDSDDNRDYNRNRQRNRDNEDSGPDAQLKEDVRAIRKAAKGALKDGRLLVIAVDKMPTDSEARRERVSAIRKLKPPFPVYDSETGSALFDATGKALMSDFNIRDLAEGERLTNALAEAPDYIPGRIILFRTKSHETVSKQLVEGKNITKVVAQLRQEARGKNEKAEEARLMVEAVQAHIDGMCAAIDQDLAGAPSRAVERIVKLEKTMPAAARPYLSRVQPLRNDPNVKQLSAARAFLASVDAGKVGRGDMGRGADAFLKKLEPLTKVKNTAIATEANDLSLALAKITTEALAKEDNAAREARLANRKKEKEEREAAKKKPEKEDSSRGNNTRPTAYTVLSATLGTSIDPIKDELLRLDDATCNYESLRNSYTKYEGQKSEKAAAAKALIDDINMRRQELLASVTGFVKEKRPFALFEEKDWENLLSVNYPSVGTTPEGRMALKILRDSEVKRIYGALEDVERGTPNQKEGEAQENYEQSLIQYKQAKLKALQKYRKTSSALGKLCVADLDSRGYTDQDITSKLEGLAEDLKAAKKAQKEAKKAEKERERNRD